MWRLSDMNPAAFVFDSPGTSKSNPDSKYSIQLIDNLSVEKIDDVVGVCGIVL